MFLAAVFLLFIGTLVQDEKNLPDVKAEYFNSWVAIVRLADFLPVTIFQAEGWRRIPGWFPFPGGGTIGLVLLVNLIAAKITRFHVAASGPRLAWGIVVSILGGLLTLAVVLTGHAGEGLQGQPPVSYATVWRLVQAGAVALAVGLGWAAANRDLRASSAACSAFRRLRSVRSPWRRSSAATPGGWTTPACGSCGSSSSRARPR